MNSQVTIIVRTACLDHIDQVSTLYYDIPGSRLYIEFLMHIPVCRRKAHLVYTYIRTGAPAILRDMPKYRDETGQLEAH